MTHKLRGGGLRRRWLVRLRNRDVVGIKQSWEGQAPAAWVTTPSLSVADKSVSTDVTGGLGVWKDCLAGV